MNITADITYLLDGELDTARNIVVEDRIIFEDLMELWELLGVTNKGLYYLIEGELRAQAHKECMEIRREMQVEREWFSRQ